MNDNKLSGTIPASLGNLKLLTSLNLNNNPALEGPVPPNVSYLVRPGSDFNFSNNPNMCGPRIFGLTVSHSTASKLLPFGALGVSEPATCDSEDNTLGLLVFGTSCAFLPAS